MRIATDDAGGPAALPGGGSEGDAVSIKVNGLIPSSFVDAPFGQGTDKGDGRTVGQPGTPG